MADDILPTTMPLSDHPNFRLEKKQRILSAWLRFLQSGCRLECFEKIIMAHFLEVALFYGWNKADTDSFWRYYFGATTGMIFQFFAIVSKRAPGRPGEDWLADGPAADLNRAMGSVVDQVYDQMFHQLRSYETERAAEMIEIQLEMDAFRCQDDFPGLTLAEIAKELTETSNYSWVHHNFTRVVVTDDIHRFLAQFFKVGTRPKATPIHQPILFATYRRSQQRRRQGFWHLPLQPPHRFDQRKRSSDNQPMPPHRRPIPPRKRGANPENE
jgi:hypothetical protein